MKDDKTLSLKSVFLLRGFGFSFCFACHGGFCRRRKTSNRQDSEDYVLADVNEPLWRRDGSCQRGFLVLFGHRVKKKSTGGCHRFQSFCFYPCFFHRLSQFLVYFSFTILFHRYMFFERISEWPGFESQAYSPLLQWFVGGGIAVCMYLFNRFLKVVRSLTSTVSKSHLYSHFAVFAKKAETIRCTRNHYQKSPDRLDLLGMFLWKETRTSKQNKIPTNCVKPLKSCT